MCGICGIIADDRQRPIDRAQLTAMNRSLAHRGPDDEGMHFAPGVGLAMRRLAVIDVAGGHQPVTDERGDVVAVCNGEIYNFRALRVELAAHGHELHSQSDVEVLPHLYEDHGSDAIARLQGMFALALWDRPRRRLLLARDRMGKKPLYWTEQAGFFLFASELKALLIHPAVMRTIDPHSLAQYLAYEYVPTPQTIFSKIHRLAPGHLLLYEAGQVVIRRYWDVPTEGEFTHLDENEAVAEFRQRFETAVAQRLIADVPLGVFLSGGIDSSSVVAAMTKFVDAERIKTFSIAFAEKSFDESSAARRVADHFGTDHHEETVSAERLLALLPEVTTILDEPLGDASIVPTLALAKFTRQHVTVALGGDGGDELFAGYPTFPAEVWWRRYQRIPEFLRHYLIEPVLTRLPVSDENISFDFKVKQFLKGAGTRGAERHVIWLGSFSPRELDQLLVAAPLSGDLCADVARHTAAAYAASPGNQLLYLYQKLYLHDDILAKVDRATMAASLECRAPFLDQAVVEFVARLPYHYKLRGMTMKYLLKKAYGAELPPGIAARPKKGFGIPVAQWLKGPLLPLARDYFSEARITREGFFRPAMVTKLLEDHLHGRVDNRKKLWTLLIFERWLEHWGRSSL